MTNEINTYMKPEELEDMTTLTIKTNALDNNIRIIKRLANGAKVIAVLKGNAYGLGLTKFASFLQSKGIDNYGVTELSDAVTLRRNGITGNILLMTPLYNSEDITTAIDHDITLSITSTDCAHVIDETAAYMNHPTVHAHLCIDTGFGRYGFLCSEEKQIADTVQSLRHVRITGIFSHFHAAACRNEYYVKKQFQDFTHLCDALRKDGVPVGIRHISSSTSMIKYPSMNLDAIRIGSAFLGRLAVPNDYGFREVCNLSAYVDDIYELPAGHNIGYGHSFKLSHNAKTAVISAGYYHGLGMERHTDSRTNFFSPIRIYYKLKGTFHKKTPAASFKDCRLPVLGQISMNSVIVDTTGCNISVGDTVTFPINPIFVNSAVPRVYM